MVATILIAGCDKKSPSSSVVPPPAQANAAPLLPIAQSALIAWQQGDKAAAIRSFVAADWSSRPLFETGSVLNLSEDQFKALPSADSGAKAQEMITQISWFKQVSDAVAQAGIDAAAKGDTAQAREYLTSFRQFGLALESQDYMRFVNLYGKGIENKANAELAKIGQ
jgi:poly-gamma-glutamate capsule biosynthesis protein CapA/YwtB (metallophosphatase superfamily)